MGDKGIYYGPDENAAAAAVDIGYAGNAQQGYAAPSGSQADDVRSEALEAALATSRQGEDAGEVLARAGKYEAYLRGQG